MAGTYAKYAGPSFGGGGGGGSPGITQLTGDVLAGPGSGPQAATVVQGHFNDGSQAAPSMAFGSEPDLGWYKIAGADSDTIALAVDNTTPITLSDVQWVFGSSALFNPTALNPFPGNMFVGTSNVFAAAMGAAPEGGDDQAGFTLYTSAFGGGTSTSPSSAGFYNAIDAGANMLRFFTFNNSGSVYKEQLRIVDSGNLELGIFNVTNLLWNRSFGGSGDIGDGVNDPGQVNFKSSLSGGYRQTATSTTTTVNDYVIGVTSTASARTITLVAAATFVPAGTHAKVLYIKDESGGAGTNNITVAGTVDGASNPFISANYGVMKLYCNGTAYFSF